MVYISYSLPTLITICMTLCTISLQVYEDLLHNLNPFASNIQWPKKTLTYSCLTYPMTWPTGASTSSSNAQQLLKAHQQQPAQHLNDLTMRITSCPLLSVTCIVKLRPLPQQFLWRHEVSVRLWCKLKCSLVLFSLYIYVIYYTFGTVTSKHITTQLNGLTLVNCLRLPYLKVCFSFFLSSLHSAISLQFIFLEHYCTQN